MPADAQTEAQRSRRALLALALLLRVMGLIVAGMLRAGNEAKKD